MICRGQSIVLPVIVVLVLRWWRCILVESVLRPRHSNAVYWPEYALIVRVQRVVAGLCWLIDS